MESVALKIIVLCLTGCSVSFAAKWSYEGTSGPLYWHELFPDACSGLQQSPIDIKAEETLYNPNLKEFAIWYDPPKPDSKMTIKNNGHTVQVDLEGEFYVTNAGLPHVYKAAQFHFHWGHKVHYGSEHTMEGKQSPIELHLVTYNKDVYSNIGAAVTERGGLAVLGVMYEVSKEDNPGLEGVVRALKHVKDPELKTKISIPLVSLRDLLPDNISNYYRYNGSLTTPGCFESVTWTVFEMKQKISHRQLREFRKLLQFKREKKHGSDRHRRSAVSDAEKKAEHEATKVIDELGIKDDLYQQEVLESKILEKRNEMMMADHHGKSEQAVNVGQDKASASEGKDEPKYETVEPTEPVIVEYVQDVIVNNFRPVQLLNGRLVERSFKLRQPPVVVEVVRHDDQQSRDSGYRSHGGHGDGGHGDASHIRSSLLTLIFAICICMIIRSQRS